MRNSWSAIAVALLALGTTNRAEAATLPAHDPVSIVVVADEVNPHGLAPPELTQPADVEAAIGSPNSGISIASLQLVDSGCVDDALDAMGSGGADVLVYFAHRGASMCGGGSAQADFDASVEDFLRGGGGVVVLHHGIYTDPNKRDLLALLGATASQLEWNTSAGQDIINVAPDHFVTSNEVEYAQTRAFEDAGLGVAAGDYGVFNNTPDERYPGLSLLTEAGESREVLFASDYAGAQALGYDLHRPQWAGHVVVYQPGEYQPNALDDLDGNNFQILANAIYYVATTQEEPVDPPGGSTGDAETSGGPTGNDSETSGGPGGNTNATQASSASDTASDTDTDAGPGGDNDDGGCACRSGSPRGGWLALPLLLAFLRRRT